MEKTNAARALAAKKLPFKEYFFDTPVAVSGVEMAAAIGKDCEKVFKTLVTVGKSGAHYVFMIPVAEELDLKKAAQAVGEKNVEMVKSKDLLPLTGYVHGGCSPVGMKKFFTTAIHNTAEQYPTITFSGGRIGYQVEMSLSDLQKAIKLSVEDLIKCE